MKNQKSVALVKRSITVSHQMRFEVDYVKKQDSVILKTVLLLVPNLKFVPSCISAK